MLINFNIIIVDENGKPSSRKFWNQRLNGVETLSIN